MSDWLYCAAVAGVAVVTGGAAALMYYGLTKHKQRPNIDEQTGAVFAGVALLVVAAFAIKGLVS